MMKTTLVRVASPIVLALLCTTDVVRAADGLASTFTVAPAAVQLQGSRGRQQLLATITRSDGTATDATRDAKFASQDSSICEVNSVGIIVPRSNGETLVEVSSSVGKASVAVTVVGMETPATVDFRTDVISTLSRVGCSQGACHGSPQGKGGFRLSLNGFDPTLDYLTLVREDSGRRSNVLQPDDSLILLKASARIPHQGGVRFHPQDDSYRTLRDWFAGGCVDSKTPRKLTKLETIPAQRVLTSGQPKQQLVALAHFEDGSVVDVTHQAVFTTGHDAAYGVNVHGLVEFTATAEASILVRYLEKVQSVQLTYVETDPAYVFRGPAVINDVDKHVFAKQQSLQLQPAAVASDEAFLRRVYLDVLGALPTVDEAREFLDSQDGDKRNKLIDRLLKRPEFANFWALKWADVMRGNRNTISQRGVHSWHRYLVDHFAEDRPFDQLAREILTSSGNTLHRPAANFFRIARTPEDAAESFGQLFLGVRLQCAKCHNHPFEAMTQNDYYGLAAYFARVKLKGRQFGRDDEVVYLVRQGEVQHPLTRKNLEPVVFGTSGGTFTPDDDRRTRLADWLVAPENRFFARSTVNRIWHHLMGKGIVEPVDDFRDTNPPTNPELLDALAQDFVSGGYRFQPIIRTILRSNSYQRSAENKTPQSPRAANPARYYVQADVRKLTAEQVVDAISAAVGLPEPFAGYPTGTRAIELAEGAVDNHFLMALSRPSRDAACDCAREEDSSLNETLHLLNNLDLVKKIASPQSRLAQQLAANKPTTEIVETTYLATLSRRPTDQERKLIDNHIELLGDRAVALQDLQHALINSPEFLLRH